MHRLRVNRLLLIILASFRVEPSAPVRETASELEVGGAAKGEVRG
jgi:hypothetical protein